MVDSVSKNNVQKDSLIIKMSVKNVLSLVRTVLAWINVLNVLMVYFKITIV